MEAFDLLLWMWAACALCFVGDGLMYQGKSRNAKDLGRVLYCFSGAMLVIAIVAIEKFAREGLL